MSLRFIPDSTKISPLKMFLNYAERKEKKELKIREKKLLSFEYFLYTRGMLNNLFGFQGQFLNSILNEFNIEEKNSKQILKELLSNFEEKYFKSGKLDIAMFERNYSFNLKEISEKFKTTDEHIIADIIVSRNEYKEVLQKEDSNNFESLQEFKKSLEERKKEMEFLTMYLAKTNKEDYSRFIDKNESSQLVNDIAARSLFVKMRNEYQEELKSKVKQSKKLKAH